MVRSCVQAIWCVKQLDLPLEIKLIILMKIREAFKQEMKFKQSLPFNGSSLYAIKRRAKRISCCYRCGKFTCNSVRRESGKLCNGLQLSSAGQDRRVQLCRELLSKTKKIWSEMGYLKWDQRDALKRQEIW